MDIQSYRNQVVLITGAAGGFGRLLAEKLAASGARLVLGDLNEDGLGQLAEGLRHYGAELVLRRCDVTSEQQVRELVSASVAGFGRLDIGINHAGIAPPMKRLG